MKRKAPSKYQVSPLTEQTLLRMFCAGPENFPLMTPVTLGSITAVMPCEAASSRRKSGSGFSLATIWNGRLFQRSSAAIARCAPARKSAAKASSISA